MIYNVLTFFLAMLTEMWYHIENLWTLEQDISQGINIQLGDLILWLLCITALMSVIGKLYNSKVKRMG